MTPNSSAAGRLAAVSHLFLSDVRNKAGQTPVRNAPQTSHPHPPPPQQMDQPERADPSLCQHHAERKKTMAEDSSPGNTTACQTSPHALPCTAVLAVHLGPAAAEAIMSFAEHLAREGQRPALLWLDGDGASLQSFHVIRPDQARQHNTFPNNNLRGYSEDDLAIWQQSAGDGELSEQLMMLRGQVECLLVCWQGDFHVDMDRLLALVDNVAVLCGGDEHQMLGCYGQLKQYSHLLAGKSVGIFVTGAPDEQLRRRISRRIIEAARQFLGLDLFSFNSAADTATVECRFAGRRSFAEGQTQTLQEFHLSLLKEITCGDHADPDRPSGTPIVTQNETATQAEQPPTFPASCVNGKQPLLVEVPGNGKAEAGFELLLRQMQKSLPAVRFQRWAVLSEWGLKLAKVLHADRWVGVLIWSNGEQSWPWSLALQWVLKSAAAGAGEQLADKSLVILSETLPPWAYLAGRSAGFGRVVHWPCMQLQYNGTGLLALAARMDSLIGDN